MTVSAVAGSPPWALALTFVAAYLVGSIPFGLILTQWAGLGDIRRIGSGNIGATNVLRTGRRGLAAATLLLDAGKGAVAVALAGQLGPVAAAGAVLGHIFPPWLGFKGGKAVATAFGAVLVLSPPVAGIALATWLAVAFTTRYSSLAALAAVLAAGGAALILASLPDAVAILVIVMIIIWRHQGNIRRLLAGKESRIQLRRG